MASRHTHTHTHIHRLIPLKPESSVEIRLLDDAFIKTCDMVNDLSMTVRALAAGLLGDFHNVSVKFLEQTLDKKLMSHLRVGERACVISDSFQTRGGGGFRNETRRRIWE